MLLIPMEQGWLEGSDKADKDGLYQLYVKLTDLENLVGKKTFAKSYSVYPSLGYFV
jgi:hypothetical protein